MNGAENKTSKIPKSGTLASSANAFPEELKSVDAKIKGFTEEAKSSAHMDAQSQGVKIFEPQDLLRYLEIKPGYSVAEFGAGVGNITLALAKHFPDSLFYAVDIQKDLLIKLLNDSKLYGLDNVYAVWGDIEKRGGSKLQDASQDLVIIVNSFFMLEDKDTALLEAMRILKKGAFLVVVDWKKDITCKFAPRADLRVSKDELIEKCTSLSYSFVETYDIKDTHYFVKFVKIT